MKKKLNLVLFLLLLCMAAGCDKKTVSTDGIRIYYRALSENGISSRTILFVGSAQAN